MAESKDIRLFGLINDSIVDGPGLRFGVFTQGCSHDCPGCHNPESHDPQGGTLSTIDHVLSQIAANPLVDGVTLSGGEPFEQAAACAVIARECKARGISVWAYTGYLLEDLQKVAARGQAAGESDEEAPIYAASQAKRGNLDALDAAGVRDLLGAIDVLVDGPFVQKLHSYDLNWRGSSNQRLIDMNATRKRGAVVLWRSDNFVPPVPTSW